MKHFGITEATASWLLGKAGLIDSIHDLLTTDSNAFSDLARRDFAQGPIRLAADAQNILVCFWNVDYSSGSGDDPWGFFSFGSDFLDARNMNISREVLERCLYVISQRLQGLLIDGAFIHRAWPNGAHTCLAGRGTDARQVNLGYVERDIHSAGTIIHAILCVGPKYDLNRLSKETIEQSTELNSLVPLARKLADPARKKMVMSSSELSHFRSALAAYFEFATTANEFGEINVLTQTPAIAERDSRRTAGWTYQQWLAHDSPLTPVQRQVLLSNALDRHPVRIIGPGGSGKTLLMLLLALRRLDIARAKSAPVRILYLVHNAKMAETVLHRFTVLRGNPDNLVSSERQLIVRTLTELGRTELDLDASQIIDPDAHEAKEFQLEVLQRALTEVLKEKVELVEKSALFSEVINNPVLQPVLVRLIMIEVSSAIKGHGLAGDERRYVESERALSRLHGVLRAGERRLIYGAFTRYHKEIFEGYGVLDSDDVAISLLGKLRTPIWELKRREMGFDHMFVDETQLFNENERRVLPFLTKSTHPYVPIVLALDEAQDIYGQASSGLAALGIENVASHSLNSIHRSSKAIIRLAFFVIQRSTDLFGADFPDFTGIADTLPEDHHPLSAMPHVETMTDAQENFGKVILKRIRFLRKANLWRIAVICLAEQYWRPVLDELRKAELALHVLETRGERLSQSEPVVVLSRVAHIGGQEFDAVILVGAEQGLCPPRVIDNDALAVAVEQQALRELYLSITRARHQVIVALARGAALTPVLNDASAAGLLEHRPHR